MGTSIRFAGFRIRQRQYFRPKAKGNSFGFMRAVDALKAFHQSLQDSYQFLGPKPTQEEVIRILLGKEYTSGTQEHVSGSSGFQPLS